MEQKKETKPDFEQAVAQLEAIIARLEVGELTLEQALEQFEHGVALVKDCRDALARAEKRVQVLMEKDGRLALQDLAEHAEDDAGG